MIYHFKHPTIVPSRTSSICSHQEVPSYHHPAEGVDDVVDVDIRPDHPTDPVPEVALVDIPVVHHIGDHRTRPGVDHRTAVADDRSPGLGSGRSRVVDTAEEEELGTSCIPAEVALGSPSCNPVEGADSAGSGRCTGSVEVGIGYDSGCPGSGRWGRYLAKR